MDKITMGNANNKPIEWIVLTKAPVPGLVKTRLIPELGEQAACELYQQLLKRMEGTLKKLVSDNAGQVALWIAGDAEHEAFKPWSCFAAFYHQPTSGDLGVRMALAVKSALSRNCIPILIGVDVPDLDEAYLLNCLQQLENHDLVISPAEDGGYGLLAMKQFYPQLFIDKDWGSDRVFSVTKSDIESFAIKSAYLPMVWDVDEIADAERFRRLSFS